MLLFLQVFQGRLDSLAVATIKTLTTVMHKSPAAKVTGTYMHLVTFNKSPNLLFLNLFHIYLNFVKSVNTMGCLFKHEVFIYYFYK